MEDVDSVTLQSGLALVKQIEKAKKGEIDQQSTNGLLRKEFQWDDIIKWLVAAIFGLTLLNLSSDFFRDYTVTCFVPNVTVRDSIAYVNNYCYSSLPRSEYFTLFIIIHGFLIIGPHMLWKTTFDSNFNFFFDLVCNLDQLRDHESGDYSTKNIKIVTRLQTELSRTVPLRLCRWVIPLPPIYTAYLVKLSVQLLAAVGSVIFSLSFFVNFSEMFTCPTQSQQDEVITDERKWPLLGEPVTCVYPSLRFLSLLRYGNLILLALIILVILYGLIWTVFRHPDELGSSTIATYSAQSSLHADSYRPSHFWRHPLTPRIRSDIDFLLLALFQASSGQGVTFKQLQISQEMNRQYNRSSEMLQLIVQHKAQMARSRRQAEQEGRQLEEPYRLTDAVDLHQREGFRWPVKIDFKGTPRFEVEASHKHQLGLMEEDREHAAPNKSELTLIAEQLHSVDDFTDFFNELFSKTGAVPKYPEDRTEHTSRFYNLLPKDPEPMKAYQTMLHQWSQHGGTVRLLAKTLIDRGHGVLAERLTSGTLANKKANIREERSFKNRLYGFLQLVKPHRSDIEHRRLAFNISFDGLGCSFIMAWVFDNVCALNFHSHYRNRKKKVMEERLQNRVNIITLPIDYYSLPASSEDNFDRCLENVFFMSRPVNYEEREKRRKGFEDKLDRYINLFTVGPITEDSRRVTVNLLLERFNVSYDIANNSLMITVRPLQINGTNVKHQFLRYIPPKDLFKPLEDEQEGTYADEQYSSIRTMTDLRQAIGPSSYCTVDGVEGLICYCGDVECVIEIRLYRYIGRK